MHEQTLALVRCALVSAFLTLQPVRLSVSSCLCQVSTTSSKANSLSWLVSAVTPLSLIVFKAMSTPRHCSSDPSNACRSVLSTPGDMQPMKGCGQV